MKRLCHLNWQTPVIPPKWLRFLYRKEFLQTVPGNISLPFECDFFGMRYIGDICNVIDFHCYFYGAFEKGHLFFWRDVAQKLYAGRGTYLDIGANVGHHSLFMAPLCSAVHAFEPYEPVREKILEKVERNQLSNLYVHGVGLSDQDQALPFHAPAGTNLGLGSFVDGQVDRNAAAEILQVVKGDAYFDQEIGGEVHMVKLDVEGFEKKALAGFHKTLEKNRPVMVMEITTGLPCSFTSLDDIKATLPANYRLFMFDLMNGQGQKDKQKEDAFRKKGTYHLVPFDFNRVQAQADIIAFPEERFREM